VVGTLIVISLGAAKTIPLSEKTVPAASVKEIVYVPGAKFEKIPFVFEAVEVPDKVNAE
jgi:hypothetical protein